MRHRSDRLKRQARPSIYASRTEIPNGGKRTSSKETNY